MKARFVYESMNILRPKSKDEIVQELSSLSQKEKNEKLLWASHRGHSDIVSMFLDVGADIEAKNNYGQTPLIWASQRGHSDIVSMLLDAGADIETRDKNGQTPLMRASYYGHSDVVNLLKKHVN